MNIYCLKDTVEISDQVFRSFNNKGLILLWRLLMPEAWFQLFTMRGDVDPMLPTHTHSHTPAWVSNRVIEHLGCPLPSPVTQNRIKYWPVCYRGTVRTAASRQPVLEDRQTDVPTDWQTQRCQYETPPSLAWQKEDRIVKSLSTFRVG